MKTRDTNDGREPHRRGAEPRPCASPHQGDQRDALAEPSALRIVRSLQLSSNIDVTLRPTQYANHIDDACAELILNGVIEASLAADGSVRYRGTPVYPARANGTQRSGGTGGIA